MRLLGFALLGLAWLGLAWLGLKVNSEEKVGHDLVLMRSSFGHAFAMLASCLRHALVWACLLTEKGNIEEKAEAEIQANQGPKCWGPIGKRICMS